MAPVGTVTRAGLSLQELLDLRRTLQAALDRVEVRIEARLGSGCDCGEAAAHVTTDHCSECHAAPGVDCSAGCPQREAV